MWHCLDVGYDDGGVLGQCGDGTKGRGCDCAQGTKESNCVQFTIVIYTDVNCTIVDCKYAHSTQN